MVGRVDRASAAAELDPGSFDIRGLAAAPVKVVYKHLIPRNVQFEQAGFSPLHF